MEKKKTLKICGFTLIELLVSMLVISILVGLGYANFRKYSQKQALWSVARQIEGDLRLAQSYAMSGENASCSLGYYFYGYDFERVLGTRYQLRAVCRNPSDGSLVFISPPVKLENINSAFKIDGDKVIFRAVTGGVDNSANFIIYRSDVSHPYITISISLSGVINLTYTD